MTLTVRFQETLRRLAAIGGGFAEDGAGLALGPAAASAPGSQDRGPGAGGDQVAGAPNGRYTRGCLGLPRLS
jgi:hypothetical protein